MQKSTSKAKKSFAIVLFTAILLSVSIASAYIVDLTVIGGTTSVPGTQEAPNCEIPGYYNDIFPPSPVQPPLPPLSDQPYQHPNHVCYDFANEFCQEARNITDIKQCFVLIFDSHAANLIRFVDSDGKSWTCVVEPQTNEYYCMPSEDWKNLDQDDWIEKTLCEGYYDKSKDECEKNRYIVPLCEDIEGKSCSLSDRGKRTGCFPDGGKKPEHLECKCKFVPYAVCTWEPVVQGQDPANPIRIALGQMIPK